ncbi:hypothetical protein HAHE_35170 [Haloferula helveola]|uniref:Peptidase A2 domain-containing protein n=1 Tax=Haloferula helveola TaxID=490095 RepID=A0ABM7RH70_9BACT|nr:hypothetical protein HAHE_35170 [Haloferula helveola]
MRVTPPIFGSFGLLLVSSGFAERPTVTLGPSDGLALDQPRVAVEFLDDSDTPLGPDISNSFLLDTGAERIVIAGGAFSELDANGYQTDGTILEQGVSGFTTFDVSVPYRMDFAGTAGDIVTLNGVRALSNPTSDFGSFGGIVGMPGMVGRVTSLDFSGFGTGDLFDAFVGVDMRTDVPASGGHRYTIPLQLFDFPITEPDPPTTADGIPFLTAIVDTSTRRRRGRFLLDTGAQISMLSERLAFDLGLDTDGDGNFVNEQISSTVISGVGGNITVPILDVGRLLVPTTGGTDLAWTGVAVIILEIDPRIDGIFGSDLLTSGWIEAFLLGGGDGFIQQAQLDFLESDDHRGFMMLDITPALDTPAPGIPAVDLDSDHVADDWELLFYDDLGSPVGDSDNDRLDLILENALNTDPRRFDRNPLHITRNPDGTVTARFPRNAELPFTSLTLESSPSLGGVGTWTPVVPDSIETVWFDALTEQVSITLSPPPGTNTLYFRLSAEVLPTE